MNVLELINQTFMGKRVHIQFQWTDLQYCDPNPKDGDLELQYFPGYKKSYPVGATGVFLSAEVDSDVEEGCFFIYRVQLPSGSVAVLKDSNFRMPIKMLGKE